MKMFRFEENQFKEIIPISEGRIIIEDNNLNLYINNNRIEPISYFGNTEWVGWEKNVAQEIKYAAEQGIHLHTMVIHFPLTCSPNEIFDYSSIKQVLDYCIEADPDGYFIPRIPLYSHNISWWEKNNPEGITTYRDGSKSLVSISSDEWLRQSIEALDRGIDFIDSVEKYSKCVIGYHLSCGNTGEWFYYDYREKGVDVSEANRKGFCNWLKEKYLNIEKMNTNWNSDYKEFDIVDIPQIPFNLPGIDSKRVVLKQCNKDVIDFYSYINEINVKRIEQLSSFVKNKTSGRSLVMIFYGYCLELPDPKSGHCCLEELLKSPNIDLLASPISYQDRAQGGMLAYMSPVDSVMNNKKLWMVEDDTRTYLAVDKTEEDASFNPSIESKEDTIEIHKRNMASIIRRGIGVWFMDLWASGWLKDKDLWKNIGNLCRIYEDYKKTIKPFKPEVAFIIDEKSHYYLENPWKHGSKIAYEQQKAIYRSGVDFGLYLQSDVLYGNIPKCKLYVFLNAFSINDEYKKAINKLKENSAVLMWIYGPDIYNNKSAFEVTGINLKYHDEKILSKIVQSDGTEVGEQDEIEPFYSIDDKDTEIYGFYKNTELGAFGMKRKESHTSIFYGNIMLNPEIIRDAAKIANANIYYKNNEVFDGGSLITLHSSEAGVKDICSDRSIMDVFSNQKLESINGLIKIQMGKHETKIFKKL